MKSNERSLNMISAGSKMYIVAEPYYEFEQVVLKQNTTRTFEMGNSYLFLRSFILTPLSFNLEQQKFNETINLAASAVFKGDRVWSLLQYSSNSIMVCCSN